MPRIRKAKPDRSRVDLSDDAMARQWSKQLGRSRDDIAAAIKKVGDNCETVKKELGVHGPQFHAELAEPLAAAGADYAILVGDEMQALADVLGKAQRAALGKAIPFAHCRTAAEALALLDEFGLESGDAILVKGSNSVGLGRVVEALTTQQG